MAVPYVTVRRERSNCPSNGVSYCYRSVTSDLPISSSVWSCPIGGVVLDSTQHMCWFRTTPPIGSHCLIRCAVTNTDGVGWNDISIAFAPEVVTLNIDDLVRVRLFNRRVDQVSVNVLHYYLVNNTGVGADLVDVANKVFSEWITAMQGDLTLDVRLLGCTAQKVMPAPVSMQVRSTVASVSGLSNTNTGPGQLSSLIRLISPAEPRPKARFGRVYMPFPGAAYIGADGTPSAAWLAAVEAFRAAVITPILLVGAGANTSTLRCSLYHRAWEDDAGVVHPETYTPVTVSSVTDGFATQRRRGYYGRTNASPF